MPTPTVPPRVLANCWEDVATPRSEEGRLFWTMINVLTETNPIPNPARAKTAQHNVNEVALEKLRVARAAAERSQLPRTP
jgi:hypothetical protein